MITPTWGVTACHCIIKSDYSGYYPGTGGEITYGCNNVHQAGCQTRSIKRFVPHPCYTISCCDDHDDICLIELNSPTNMPRYAKLSGVDGALAVPTNTPVKLVGSGRSETGSGLLKMVKVNTIDAAMCRAHEPYAVQNNLINFSNVICTAGTTGKDSCGGDSGSPVVGCYAGDDWVLGVLVKGSQLPTQGPACGAAGRYAVYTKMAHYAKFVQTTLSGGKFSCAHCHKQGGSSCSSIMPHTSTLNDCDHQATKVPTGTPTVMPTVLPSGTPTVLPSGTPTVLPSARPSQEPTSMSTAGETGQPTTDPSTVKPTAAPTQEGTSFVPGIKTDNTTTSHDHDHTAAVSIDEGSGNFLGLVVGVAAGTGVVLVVIVGLVAWRCSSTGYDVVSADDMSQSNLDLTPKNPPRRTELTTVDEFGVADVEAMLPESRHHNTEKAYFMKL
eukprot:TRINITY_DN911_c0_g1_i2.p1 TRINITY_DN911_c0_g1~~TRINITY_DN911_c0_g1_i2.p1  ORF type:complete len:441 (-),score=52.10 TRINITY_DN911_c0_g1_i2:135-1457(-)